MVRRKSSSVLRWIKQKVQEGAYEITEHALLEMDEDGLEEADLLWIIRTSKLQRRLTRDPRGPRFVLRGRVPGGKLAEVVTRALEDRVRILTVYLVE